MTLVPLSMVARVDSGAGFPIANQGAQGEEFPFLKVSDMNLPGNERQIVGWNNSVSEHVRKTLRAKAFPAGTVIFPKIGAAIGTNKKRQLTRPSCVDNNVMVVVPQTDVLDADFLYFAFRAKNISDFASASNPPSIRKPDVENWRIPLPTLPQQRRIVDLLARAEGIVRLRREAAAKAAELIPALFIHHFGDPDNAEPQTLATLGSVLSRPIRNGISPSKAGKYPGKVLTLSAITRGGFDETSVKDSEFANPIADTDMVSSLDMLVCRGNGNKALVGAACFAPRDMPGVAFPDTVIAVRPDQSVVLPPYLETLWATAFIRRQIDAIAKTTNGTYKINQTGLASIRFPVPSLERQQVFCEVLAQVKGIARQQLVAELKAQSTFDALLAQAFAPT